MKRKVNQSIFWALIAVFVVLVIIMMTPAGAFIRTLGGSWFLWLFSIFGAAFFLLGVALIYFTVKEKVKGISKKFLLLTGASAVGLPVFAALHNLVYALLILWFGEDFWGPGGDEPVFFTLAIIVCPLGFLTGAIGTVVLTIKNKRAGYAGSPEWR